MWAGNPPVPAPPAVSVEEELRRVIPVVEQLARGGHAIVSVDTSTPEVILAAVAAGATLINDVRGLQRPGALEAAAASDCAVCVMHMQGEPQTMQQRPEYTDVVAEVKHFLQQARGRLRGRGHRPRPHRHRSGIRLWQDSGAQSGAGAAAAGVRSTAAAGADGHVPQVDHRRHYRVERTGAGWREAWRWPWPRCCAARISSGPTMWRRRWTH